MMPEYCESKFLKVKASFLPACDLILGRIFDLNRLLQGGSPESAVTFKHLSLKATADSGVPPCRLLLVDDCFP